MTLNEDEKRVLNASSLLNHGKFSTEIAKEVFQTCLIQMKENYDSKNEKTFIHIPYIGTVNIRFDNDIEVYDEKTKTMKIEADVTCFFSPSKEIKRCMGDLVDGNTTNIEKKIYREIQSSLKKVLTKERV